MSWKDGEKFWTKETGQEGCGDGKNGGKDGRKEGKKKGRKYINKNILFTKMLG